MEVIEFWGVKSLSFPFHKSHPNQSWWQPASVTQLFKGLSWEASAVLESLFKPLTGGVLLWLSCLESKTTELWEHPALLAQLIQAQTSPIWAGLCGSLLGSCFSLWLAHKSETKSFL